MGFGVLLPRRESAVLRVEPEDVHVAVGPAVGAAEVAPGLHECTAKTVGVRCAARL